jgi:hypothetical protein
VRALAGLVDDALGHPDPFDVVDVGAGRGELLSSLPDVPARWRLTGVDLAPDPARRRLAREVPPLEGLLFATSGSTTCRSTWSSTSGWCEVGRGRRRALGRAGAARTPGVGRGGGRRAAGSRWAWRGTRRGRSRRAGAARAGGRRRLRARAARPRHLGRPAADADRLARRPAGPPDPGRGSCDSPRTSRSTRCTAGCWSQQEALTALGIRSEPPPKELSKTDPRGYLAQLARASSAAELLDRGGFGRVRLGGGPRVGIPDPLLGSAGEEAA